MKYLHIGVWFGICCPFTCRLDRGEGLGAECLRERFLATSKIIYYKLLGNIEMFRL